MNKQVKSDLPGIVSLTAILGGILLFLVFGEILTGMKPNLVWIAWLTGFFVFSRCAMDLADGTRTQFQII